MEVLLLHRARGQLPPELLKASIEVGKQILTKGARGGGKLTFSYTALNKALIICLVDTPSMDSVLPTCQQMNMIGWDTEIIPVDKTADATPKIEKALAEMAKMMKK
jgi:hypothetical protein